MKKYLRLVKGLLIVGVLSLFVLGGQGKGECFATFKYQEVPLGFASIRVPADTYVSYYDITALVDAYARPSKSEREILNNLRIYQLAMDDGENYRTAFLFALVDTEKMDKFAVGYLGEPLSEEKKQEILSKQAEFRAEATVLLQKGKAFWNDLKAKKAMRTLHMDNVGKLGGVNLLGFELKDVEFSVVRGKQAYNGSYRVFIDWNGIFFINYGKGYLLNYDEKMAGIAFFTMDSDREFWTRIFDYGVKNMTFPEK